MLYLVQALKRFLILLIFVTINKPGLEKYMSKAYNYGFVWYKMSPSAHCTSSFPGTDENRLHVMENAYSLSNTLGVIKDGMTEEIPQLLRKVH